MPSQLTNLALLAMASSAAAFPFKANGGYGGYPTAGSSSAPFPIHNGTRLHPGTAPGTAFPTTLPVETPASTVVEAGVPTTYETTVVSEYQTVVETRVLTIYPVAETATASSVAGSSNSGSYGSGSGSSNSGSSNSGSGSGVCSSRSTSTTTVTEKVTVTVTPGSGASPTSVAAGAASSSKAKVCTKITTPLPSSLIAIATTATPAPVYSAASSSSVVLDVSSFSLFSTVESSAAAPSSSAAASSYVAEPVSSSAAAVTSAAVYTSADAAEATTSAAAATSTAATYSSSGAKRGVAYNDASLTNVFVGNSKFSWGYNWGQVSAGLSSSFEYVPMIWGTGSDFTTNWFTNAKTAISNGATHLLAFNEPDHTEQANLTPAAAATGYMTYMQPFKSSNPDVKLGSPAVTNGGNGMGLDWLSSFMTACSSCTIDFVNIHWYDAATNIEYFKTHVENAYKQTGKPIWLTEFGATGSDSEIATFISEAVAWLDSQDYVERYAYFMVKTGSLVSSSTSLSSYGSTYASA